MPGRVRGILQAGAGVVCKGSELESICRDRRGRERGGRGGERIEGEGARDHRGACFRLDSCVPLPPCIARGSDHDLN